jgi:hypothetical protein
MMCLPLALHRRLPDFLHTAPVGPIEGNLLKFRI